ncbi:MAG: ABC transporter permease subunit [Zoogloeaceae bacterium]|jgi:NitT/TauT family transport system permease protein|nr:ABC transporter permease subunit [Zoogloeaceae bacterium]
MSASATLERLPTGEPPLEPPDISILNPPGALQASKIPIAAYAANNPWKKNFRFYWFGLLAIAAWGLLGAITLAWPNQPAGFEDWAYTAEFGIAALVVAALWLFFTISASVRNGFLQRASNLFRHSAPWIVVSALLLTLWEILTAKTGVLPPPFFAPPSSLIDVYLSDYARLADSAYNSIKLLLEGVAWGAAVGFTIGVSIGWSRTVNYWVHPLLRFLGPLPPTALLPIAFYFFPSSHAASVFLIALATGFPVAILSWSGVAGVNKAYYDVARTMGASEWFLIFRVAIPAALPQVFVGLFMGFGASFVVLIVAEMMGVKSGLGWYLTWAQGYAAYVNMYGGLIVMTILFSSLISLLFTVRDRVLVWQKGIVKW